VAERHARSIEGLLDFNVRYSAGDGARLLSAADGMRTAPTTGEGDAAALAAGVAAGATAEPAAEAVRAKAASRPAAEPAIQR